MMTGEVTALLSSSQLPVVVSYQLGLGGGAGMFLLGGRNTQQPPWHAPRDPAPYRSVSGAKGKMMQTAGSASSGSRISEVRVWCSSSSASPASSRLQKAWSSSPAGLGPLGMNQVGFSGAGGGWARAAAARRVSAAREARVGIVISRAWQGGAGLVFLLKSELK